MCGRDYSYLDVDLYTEHGTYGAKTYVVFHNRKLQRFKHPFSAAKAFALLVDKLRRRQTGDAPS